MLFSVIVPIYKVEEYLVQCIESVLNQSFKDYELILVNDGSPDKSGMICNQYGKKDNRIKVIHKENGGLSDARNRGLSEAKGEYIWFLDSDDYMAESAMDNVAKMILSNPHTDMITCAHIKTYDTGDKKIISLGNNNSLISIDRNEYIYRLNKSSGSNWAAWKNIYRNSIIIKHRIEFSKGLIGAEDCDFFMKFLRCAEKFSYLNIPLVYYRTNREGSITNTMSKAAIIGQLEVFKNNYNIYDAFKDEETKTFFANKFANTISLLYYLKKRRDIDHLIRYIREYRHIIKDSKGLKYYIAKMIWSIFGYYRGSMILRQIKDRI